MILYLFQPISARAIDSCHLQVLQHSISQPNLIGAKGEASAQMPIRTGYQPCLFPTGHPDNQRQSNDQAQAHLPNSLLKIPFTSLFHKFRVFSPQFLCRTLVSYCPLHEPEHAWLLSNCWLCFVRGRILLCTYALAPLSSVIWIISGDKQVILFFFSSIACSDFSYNLSDINSFPNQTPVTLYL